MLKNKSIVVDCPATKAILLEYCKDGSYFPILFPTESKAKKMHLHSLRKKESIILHNVLLTGCRVEFVDIQEVVQDE